MIVKINLALKKQGLDDAPQSESKWSNIFSRAANSSLDFKNQGASFYGRIIFALVLAGGLYYGLDYRKVHVLEEFQQKEAALLKEQTELTDYEVKTRDLQARRDELEKAEAAITRKLNTINLIISKRSNPPKLLVSLSQTIPTDVWLTGLSLDETKAQIKGSSLGLSTVSDFMKNLEETIYFKEVALKSSVQEKQLGVERANFDLEALRR